MIGRQKLNHVLTLILWVRISLSLTYSLTLLSPSLTLLSHSLAQSLTSPPSLAPRSPLPLKSLTHYLTYSHYLNLGTRWKMSAFFMKM